MIVCHCQRVSDRRIRDCIAAGASTEEEVGLACGAGTECGGCRPLVSRILRSGPLELATWAAATSEVEAPGALR